MTENEVSRKVLDAAYRVHSELGPGLLESVYETALAFELMELGLRVERQVGIPVCYKGIQMDHGFRADLIVESCLIVEIKSIETLPRVAFKILLTYLRMSGVRLGLILNFQEEHLKDGVTRVVDRLPERQTSVEAAT